MRISRIAGTIVLIWLLIGVFAVWQRGYFGAGAPSCAVAADLGVTVIAGPLNYLGVNPQAGECRLPEPSQ